MQGRQIDQIPDPVNFLIKCQGKGTCNIGAKDETCCKKGDRFLTFDQNREKKTDGKKDETGEEKCGRNFRGAAKGIGKIRTGCFENQNRQVREEGNGQAVEGIRSDSR